MTTRTRFSWLSVSLLTLLAVPGHADGLFENAGNARSMALGGVFVGSGDDPYGSMAQNPAGLGLLGQPVLDLSASALLAQGRFSNAANTNAKMDSSAGIAPMGAFGMPLSHRVSIGLALTPQMLGSASWRYADAPGGIGGVSYGLQREKSAILAMRAAAGVGVYLSPRVSVGATLGAVYNTNTFDAPYIFQTNPLLKGFKTLLDMHTQGVGWNASAGVLFHPTRKSQLGLAYKSRTVIESHGDATGNAGKQFEVMGAPFQPDFHYHAQVRNVLPQSVTASALWRLHPRLRVAVQGDWINWNRAFVNLPVTLTGGSNPDINAFAGSATLRDAVPLAWRNELIGRAGFETPMGEHVTLRGGYSYGSNPVPSKTLTPLSASILQQQITTGAGYRWGRYSLDGAYAWSPTASASVGQSELQAGEFDRSRVKIGMQTVTVSCSTRW